jgi:pimeloyl-ACP methyl ester carboxylesterase
MPRRIQTCQPWRATLALAAMLAACVMVAQAQPRVAETGKNPHTVHALVVHQSRYEFRTGEAANIIAPRETLDFIRKAKSRTVRIDGREARGFVFGPSFRGDSALIATSHMVKPGEYSVTLSAISDTGEERVTTLSVVLNPMQPVPSTATRPPVVLLNGWQFSLSNGGCPISSGPSDTFGNLAQYLGDNSVPVVYFFDNCVECPNCMIEDLGNALGQFLNLIQYDTGALVPQIDVVTHSMGGLITRAYLSGLQANGSLVPPANPRVRKLVFIAEPNFGSFIATNIGTQTAEMIPGSPLLWELATWNQGGDDLRGVDAIGIIGNAGSWNSLLNASDGVVSLTSGSIGFARDQSRTRILPYCHINPSFLVDLFMDCSTQPGIAEIDSPMHPTWTIIQSFLAGTSDWASIGATPSADPYLSRYGGVYFAVQGATGQYLNNLTQVTFGNTALLNGASPSVFYNEFVSGTETFEATSPSLGQISYGPAAVPIGHFVALRDKLAPAILSVAPLLPSVSLLVESGAAITINGSGFGQQQCSSCAVWAYPGPTSLHVLSWSDRAITVILPSSSGFVQLVVQTGSGSDEINIMTTALSLAGSIAQLASGGGWDTTLTLVNTGVTPGEALLNFFGNDGSPLQLPLTFPQAAPPAGRLVTSTLDRTLNPNSLLVIDTQQSGNPNTQVGSAQLLANGNISGFSIFKYAPTGQEAVALLETRNAPAYVLAFDNTGVLGTGVAIANVATQAASIPVVIRDDTGTQIGTDTVSLLAQGHTSFMLTGNYAITKGKRGTIEFDTPPSGHISALGLRANGSALTTLPVLADVTANGGSMAQVASGGGWQTTFTLVNTGTSAAQAQLSFFDNTGNALSLPLTFVQSGTATTASAVSQTITAGGTLVVLTQGANAGASLVGSAQLTTTGTVSGFAIFRYNPTGQEAVVPLETRNASAYTLAFDNTNGVVTGVALANVSNQVVAVPIVLRDDTGASLGTAVINLAAHGHTSFLLTANYSITTDKRGTVEFDTPAGAQISALGLRATPADAVTTIPVLAK